MTYIEITQKEFEYVLSHLGKSGYIWKKVEQDGAKENIYLVSINNIHIKVFSSIVDGSSRGVGTDAIRVVGWDMMTDRPISSSEMRVNRTVNWSINLKNRIETVISRVINASRCKICGGIEIEMKGKYGNFMGCLNYKNHDKVKKIIKKVTKENIEFWE